MLECITGEVIRNYRLSEKVPTLPVRCDIMLFIADSDHNALGHCICSKGKTYRNNYGLLDFVMPSRNYTI